MRKTIAKQLSVFAAGLLLASFVLTGCTSAVSTANNTPATSSAGQVQQISAAKTPKYVFLFIGDGMSYAQINAAQVMLGNNKSGEVATRSLNFTQFPVLGMATTHDSTSFCPDSASTATSIACGVKTHSGVIGLAVDKTTKVTSITEKLKQQGKKIGIVSSVTINHATPAAFYAHVPSRNDYYDIALQLADSNFDYYGGGTVSQPTGKDKDKPDAFEIIKSKGYTVANTKESILALNSSSGKAYAVSPVTQDSGSLPYAIDAKEGDLSLADFVKKGIEVLDNDKGFFLMCESGKIDWSCHANDAMASIKEVINFEKSIAAAIDFAKQHPNETLILVTGDHETGGMSIGYAATGYNTAFDILNKQKMSYIAFDELIGEMKKNNPKLAFNDVMPVIKENFGLIASTDADAQVESNKPYVLTDYEMEKLKTAFAETMKEKDKRSTSAEAQVSYGGDAVSFTQLRAHETRHDHVCPLLLVKKKHQARYITNIDVIPCRYN